MFRSKLEEFRSKNQGENTLLSLDVFERVKDFVSDYINSILPEMPENSIDTYCGVGFKRNDLLYHCSDCALDETCIMCEECFIHEAHKGHNYWYTICTESSGGSCDCGESDSWRNDLQCPKHRECKEIQIGSTNASLDAKLRASLREILDFVASSVKEYISPEADSEVGENALVLYNDERHSFGDVISVLHDELQIDEERARDYANLVDQKGFAVVYTSASLNVLNRLSRKVSLTGLVTSVEKPHLCWNLIVSTEVMEVLVPILVDHSWLRALVVEWLLETNGEPVTFQMKGGIIFELKSNLQLLLISDHRLWKGFRVHCNELFNMCNSISQETKKQFATIFCENYKIVFSAYLKERREPELSIVRFSVQLFTLVSVAEHCVQNCQILPTIFSTLVDIFEPAYRGNGMSFASLRSIDYDKVNHLIHDALQIMRNLGTPMEEHVMDLAVLEPLVYVLFMLTHIDPHVRKTGDHVEFEKDNLDFAQYICFEMQRIVVELCRFAVISGEIHLIWTLLDKFVTESRTYQLYLRDEKLMKPLYKTQRAMSYFGSLSWFWGLLLQAACEQGNLKTLHPPLKLAKLFAEDSLARLIFSAEVHSNLWVRNGSILNIQDYFYCSTVFHHLTYIPDVFNCIVLASLMELDSYIKFLIDRSALFSYFDDTDQNVAIIEQILVILISSISKNIPLFDAEQILINALCSGDQNGKSLVRSLPDSITDRSGFRPQVFKLATLKTPSTLGHDAVLEIKSVVRGRFDPFYWAIPMELRMKSWVAMNEHKQFSLKRLLETIGQERYKPSESVAVAYSTISGILSCLLRINSSKFEFATVATLFYILLLPDNFFDEKEASAIENAVMNLKRNSDSSSSLQSVLNEFNELFLKSTRSSHGADISAPSSSSEKLSAADKKAKLMRKFQAQRSNFISENATDPEVADHESGYVCVVCSGTKQEDENDFVLPLQLNNSKIVNGIEGTLLRGCCHVFHRKCFNSLRGGVLRKCPLCSAAVDSCITVAEAADERLDFSSLWTLFIDDFQSSADGPDAIEKVPHTRSSYELVSAYAYTALSLSAAPIDTPISSQQLNTLETVKKNWIMGYEVAQPDSNDKEPDSSQLSILDDIQKILSVVALRYKSIWSDGQCVRYLKSIVRKYAQSNFLLINQLLHFILVGRPLRDEGSSVEVNEQEPSNATLSFALMHLITLPDRFDELLKRYLKEKCPKCDSVPRSPAVCLVCGQLCCLGDACCRSLGLGGECRQHRMSCSADTGVFLLLKNCALLLLSQNSGLIIPAPYLNAFGEHDLDLRSESALHLSHHLYYKLLGQLWTSGEIRDFITRNQNNAHMTVASWHLL